jgi:hypothetical protein
MDDAELIAKARAAREAAHDAPRAISGTSESPCVSGDAWARCSREWMSLVDEMNRRGIPKEAR